MDKIIQALQENGYPIKRRNKENTHIAVDVLSRKDLDVISEIVLRNSWSDNSKKLALGGIPKQIPIWGRVFPGKSPKLSLDSPIDKSVVR